MDTILEPYSYTYDLMKIAITMIKAPNVLAQEVNTILQDLIGSRFSGKTVLALRAWAIEFPILCEQEGLNVAVNIARNDPAGANETYEELTSLAEDIYDIKLSRKNSNKTMKTFKVGSGYIRAFGILSNRKRKTPKLGLARKGAKKDIEVNIFDEVTELESDKLVKLVNQATGGAKVNIRVFMSNPWVMSNWYVTRVAKFVGFNEHKLRTDGQIFHQQYEPNVDSIEKQPDGSTKIVKRTLKKTLKVGHITNHRINTYLSEAQHEELISAWDIDETLARVVDLGMPGVAEGLVYAGVVKKIKTPLRMMRTELFQAGLDWGTSTGPNGSATALEIGRIGKDYSWLSFDDEYYHSNANSYYKNDDTLIQEIVQKLIDFVKEWKTEIDKTKTKRLVVKFDYMAFLLGKGLEDEIKIRAKDSYQYVKYLKIQECYKYEVPVRIRSMVMLMAQGRYYVNRDKCPYHIQELESCAWDETRVVSGQSTRENKNDHTLDASEYMPSDKLNKFTGPMAGKYHQMLTGLQRQI